MKTTSQQGRTPKHNSVHIRPDSHRISALEIHEWIHDILRKPEQKVNKIQIGGIKRQVYIKMTYIEGVQDIQSTGGKVGYEHAKGEISTVRINMAGMCTRRIRIARIQTEVGEDTLRASLAQYGEILSVKEETWAQIYRYAVANSI